MECVNGSWRRATTLVKIDLDSSGRYSVRWPLESRGASAAARARGENGLGSKIGESKAWLFRMGKSNSVFAICSPQCKSTLGPRRRQADSPGLRTKARASKASSTHPSSRVKIQRQRNFFRSHHELIEGN